MYAEPNKTYHVALTRRTPAGLLVPGSNPVSEKVIYVVCLRLTNLGSAIVKANLSDGEHGPELFGVESWPRSVYDRMLNPPMMVTDAGIWVAADIVDGVLHASVVTRQYAPSHRLARV